MSDQISSASSKYAEGKTIRTSYEERAKINSALTKPSLYIGRESSAINASTDIPNAHQSLGFQGVNNLSSKMSQSLFPSNQPWAVHTISDVVIASLPQGIDPGKAQIEVSKLTRAMHQLIQETNLNTQMSEVFDHLLVTGNILIYVDEDGDIILYHIDEFVVFRDRKGKIYSIIIEEEFKIITLSQKIREQLPLEIQAQKSRDVKIYTQVELLEDGHYESWKEFSNGTEIDNSRSKYPKGVNPYIAPRMQKVVGEHYGRSYVEGSYGDLQSFDGNSWSINRFGAAASKIIPMVNPNSSETFIEDLESSEDGEWVSGNPNDVGFVQANISANFQVVQAAKSETEKRIQQLYLLPAGSQRDAERVTATEIRRDAEALNSQISGAYSILKTELQDPLYSSYQYRFRKKIKMPTDVDVKVLTGIDAIGRGQDIENLNAFAANVIELQKAGLGSDKLNPDEIVDRLAAGYGVDTNGLYKTQEALEAQAQQAQMRELDQSNAGKAMAQQEAAQADPVAQAKAQQIQAQTEQMNKGEA